MTGIGEPTGIGGFFAPVPVQRPGALSAPPGSLPAVPDPQQQEQLRQERINADRARTAESDGRQQESAREAPERRDQRVFGRPSAAFLTQVIGQQLSEAGGRSSTQSVSAQTAAVAFTATQSLVSDDEETGLVFGTSRRVDISV